jgi:hypothetical protein
MTVIGCSLRGGDKRAACQSAAPQSKWLRSAGVNHVDVRAIQPVGRCGLVISGVDLRAAMPRGVIMRTDDSRDWGVTIIPGTASVDHLAGAASAPSWALGTTDTLEPILLASSSAHAWRRIELPVGVIASDVAFRSSEVGWVVGNRVRDNTEVATILGTVDGGRTWRKYRAPAGLATIKSMSRTESGRIWLVGREQSAGGPTVVLTTTNWRRWRTQRLGAQSELSVAALGHRKAWAFGARSLGQSGQRRAVLFETRDEGRHWQPLRTPKLDSINGVLRLGGRTWITASRNGRGAVLVRQGGSPWRSTWLPCRRPRLCSVGPIAGAGRRLWAGGDGLFTRAICVLAQLPARCSRFGESRAFALTRAGSSATGRL